MQILFLSLLPFSSALSGSHVSVTIGGTTYSHGNQLDFNHISPVFAPVDEPVNTPDSPLTDPPLPLTPPISQGYFPHPSVSESLAPSPHHISPIRFLHDPVTVNKPHHVHPHLSQSVATTLPISQGYFSHPLVSESLIPSPQQVSPIRYLHDPVAVPAPDHGPHQHVPHVYAPIPVYVPTPMTNIPQQNCSIVSEMATAEVCTPSLQTTCTAMEMGVKNIVDKQDCRSITRTVCSIIEQENEHEICVYNYQEKSEDTAATNYEIDFQKECKLQMRTVCQPSASAGYTKIEDQYCKEEKQETCYNVPLVMSKQETVTVKYPEPRMNCMEKPITIPQITCQDVNEEKCFIIPEIIDDIILVEKCEVSVGAPSCQVLELILPKQVCTELVFVDPDSQGDMDLQTEALEVQRTNLESMMKMREQRNMIETSKFKQMKKALETERTKQENIMKMKEQPNMIETSEFKEMKKTMEEKRTTQESMMKMRKMHNTLETSDLEQITEMNEIESTMKMGDLERMIQTSELMEMLLMNEMENMMKTDRP